MTRIVHPLIPKGVNKVYNSTSDFSQEDYNLYYSTLKTQGISWSTLRSKAEKYIMIGKLPSDIKPGGPSLTNSSYLYAHTINNFCGIRLPETVIYVGISGKEDISRSWQTLPRSKIGIQEQFGRAFDKSEGNRNWLWYTIMDKVEGHKVNILPLRIESTDCTKLETYFIDTLGRFCYPKPYRGPLVNIQRDPRDPKEQSEMLLRMYEENPHFKGEGGVLSIIQQNIWSDSSIREAQSNRLNDHIADLTEEQKKARKENTTKHFKPFNEWKSKFMKQFCYDTTLLENLQISETGTLFDNYLVGY